jgi:hypothetical protein
MSGRATLIHRMSLSTTLNLAAVSSVVNHFWRASERLALQVMLPVITGFGYCRSSRGQDRTAGRGQGDLLMPFSKIYRRAENLLFFLPSRSAHASVRKFIKLSTHKYEGVLSVGSFVNSGPALK